MREITCMCEKTFEADLPEAIDLDKNPEYVASILDGSFMSVKCPDCGKLLKPDFPLTISNKKEGIDISYIPELDRDTYLLGKLEYQIGKPARVVIGFQELVEKMKVYEGKLDDRVIELIKYFLLTKAVESGNNGENIRIMFQGTKDGSLLFHIEGIRPDEIAVTKIEKSMYDKSAKEIDKRAKEDPYVEFLTPPYISINKIDLEK
jgi:hypothetical protein